MLHDNKDEFLKILERTSAQSGFMLSLLEKDYYLTILLSEINKLSGNLVFKGGTCLSKVYYSYYRLSEDLDFSMKLTAKEVSRSERRSIIKPVKNGIVEYVNRLGLKLDETEEAGHNESRQYIYFINYDSAVLGKEQSIKLEIGLRYNPLLPIVKRSVNHTFLHPFTREPLFTAGTVSCLSIKELVAEKMRAASTRNPIAPRDFYDIWYMVNSGFNIGDKELLMLFQKKLKEDNFDTDLTRYQVNLGRSDKEIQDMGSRIEAELLDVLSISERKVFNLKPALEVINNALKGIRNGKDRKK